jgi:hypothetical protein
MPLESTRPAISVDHLGQHRVRAAKVEQARASAEATRPH